MLGRFDSEQILESVLRLLSTSREKCKSGFLFNAKMPVPLSIVDCVKVRGIDKVYIECLNEDNYVTVWFIVGINTEIFP